MKSEMRKRWVSLYVENEIGVLAKISGLFSGKNYNIHSLTVGTTEDATVSRMTIGLISDDDTFEQIKKQLAKLVEVRKISEVDVANAVFRELLLVKVRAAEGDRANIIGICNVFRANIVDLSPTTATIEMTDTVRKNDSLIEILKDYGIMETARTGIAGLQLGETTLEGNGK